MGGTLWSDASYSARSSARAASSTPTFAYSDAVYKGKVKKATHDTMEPSGLASKPRECRDSKAHPNSNPIFVGLDVTGSMRTVPAQMQSNLRELMGYLLRKGYIEDPAICIAAIGDAEERDRAPFQVGQFESGIEIENDLTNIFIEGGGGGNRHESYDLALYYLARLVKTDAWEKRGEKGYAFIICDEMLPERCLASVANRIFGVDEKQDIPIKTLINEVLEKWELFCIVPNTTDNYRTRYQDSWVNVIGQRVIFLEDPKLIVETIAAAIGTIEDTAGNLDKDLKEVSGLSISSVSTVKNAISAISKTTTTKGKGRGLKKVTKGTGLATLT